MTKKAKASIGIGIVVADFNEEITHEMLRIAQQRGVTIGASVEAVVHVPGVFDMPLAVKKLLQKKQIQGVVTLGVVLSGGTSHDAIIAENTARQISNLALTFNKPVTLGVIGHNVTKQQALERYEHYAIHGVDAVVDLIEMSRTTS